MMSNITYENLQNQQAERALLGSIFCKCGKKMPDIYNALKVEDFSRLAYQKIYSAICRVFNEGKQIDIVTVVQELKECGDLDDVGGIEEITMLANYSPTDNGVCEYIEIIKKFSEKRRLAQAFMAGYNACFDIEESADSIKGKFMVSTMSNNVKENRMETLFDGLVKHSKIIDDRRQKADNEYLSTGFIDLDKMTGKFKPQQLILLGARPSMGKTALSTNIAINAMKKNKRVVLFSLEMSKESLYDRIVSSESTIPTNKIDNPKEQVWTEEDAQAYLAMMDRLQKTSKNLFVDDTGAVKVSDMRSKCLQVKADGGLDFIVIDYLGLIRPEKDYKGNRVAEVGEISANLKALAKEFNIPVMVLTQLNRGVEQRQDKRPTMSDIRDSGAVEQDADIIMMLYRDEYYASEENKQSGNFDHWTEVNVVKNRNGSVGMIKLMFMKEFSLFGDYSERM